MDAEPLIYLIEDDEAVCDSLICMLQQTTGFRVEAFLTPSEFLAAFVPDQAGCIVVDLQLPEMTGLQLVDEVLRRGGHQPFIVISAHATIPTAVQSIRQGALDFLQKPLSTDMLSQRVRDAIERDAEASLQRRETDDVRRRVESLTPREREVLQLVVRGKLTKQIASQLGISIKTVEVHRGNITRKMQATSLAHLTNLIAHHAPELLANEL